MSLLKDTLNFLEAVNIETLSAGSSQFMDAKLIFVKWF